MDKELTKKEMQELQKYRYNPGLEKAFKVGDLLEDKYLKSFIGNLTATIGAPNEAAAASIFMKRYAFLAVQALYAMTVWNKKLNLSTENIMMERPEPGKDWLPAFRFFNPTVQEREGEDRTVWRKEVLQELFAENIDPIITKLEKTFRISKLILWENVAIYLFWLYETELQGSSQANDDFNHLLFEAKGAVFGTFKGNPLQKYYTEKSFVEEYGTEIRTRKTCCFTYQLPAGKRCKTCPCAQIAKEGRCHDGETICSAVRGLA